MTFDKIINKQAFYKLILQWMIACPSTFQENMFETEWRGNRAKASIYDKNMNLTNFENGRFPPIGDAIF